MQCFTLLVRPWRNQARETLFRADARHQDDRTCITRGAHRNCCGAPPRTLLDEYKQIMGAHRCAVEGGTPRPLLGEIHDRGHAEDMVQTCRTPSPIRFSPPSKASKLTKNGIAGKPQPHPRRPRRSARETPHLQRQLQRHHPQPLRRAPRPRWPLQPRRHRPARLRIPRSALPDVDGAVQRL